MRDDMKLVSNAFQSFVSEAPDHAAAWGKMVSDLSSASALDKRVSALAYVAVLAALGLQSGIPFHAAAAKAAGATRDELISAILIGLPAAGHKVTQALPGALQAFDNA